MKKFAICYLLIAICAAGAAQAAVAIKKAAPVATQPTAGTAGTASLLPSVLGLVSGVIDMNKKQNELTQECIPSSAEITFVDNTMKEWAKTGKMTREEVQRELKRQPCTSMSDCYATDVQFGMTPGMDPHYNTFQGAGNTGLPWEGFPRSGKGTYCKDGSSTCAARDKTTVTDMYDLFNLIDFGPADYLPGEATMAARMMNKVTECSTAKLSARKRALWGEFIVSTAGSLGQPTNTGSIMQTVGDALQKGPQGGIGSIGQIATQFLAK